MHTFDIVPAGYRPFWFLIPIGIVMIGVAALMFVTIAGSRSARFDVSADGLRLRGDLYGRLIPMGDLRVAEARRVDWSAQPGLVPVRRTLGTGLPGYQSGWFRLANGQKALLYLTDRKRAIYVPTTRGHSLLLSPTDPDGFLTALQRASVER